VIDRYAPDGSAMTPSGTRGVLNDAMSLYFADATLASAFVARWCVGSQGETAGACSGSGRMSRRRGLGPGCTGRCDIGGREAVSSGPWRAENRLPDAAAIALGADVR
jgi:hypothetical protein